ncbi:MAG TPA: substrate-binding domain-containing protein [Pseudolabrys sp.]|uniref:substrate-binding domain-containing protein n=1 Tax=Pseudolabrys sp. TaxID=1960880 RepID=UPI002DDC9500|nr:substrate-binding domain-containing protein [Pseudolabrys sp.]HEV2630584.1 substrate-binding domain-containing protein [Pseudolabrys sp.]
MATIKVMSGGAPKEVFGKLTPLFEKQSGHTVSYSFAVMSALRDRLAGGEAADALVMPTNVLDGYEKSGVVRGQGRGVLGLVPVNAVVRTGAAKPDLGSVEAVKQAMLNARSIVFPTPGATPSGTHMGKLVETLGLAEALKAKIIHRPALEGGVELVKSGEAEIGFYPKSEVINTAGLELAGPLPADIQLTTIYGAAVTTASAAPDAAAAFVAFMRDPAHRAVWTHGGFDAP